VYDGTGRQRDATERRRRVIDAAAVRFVRDGYGATSIDEIAKDAGTSAQTVYAAFGNKAGILRRVLDVAIAGDHDDVALSDRPEFQSVFEAADLDTRVELAVDGAVATHTRSAHLIALVQSLSGSDPAVKELSDDLDGQVRIDTERFLALAGDRLRDDYPMARLVDIALMAVGPLPFHHLVNERGWTTHEWRAWAIESIRRLVLKD
jgi:AcrR family transcriptional regulator